MISEASVTTYIGAAELGGACEARSCSRDIAAEKAALSLAHRRGKCAPCVDTKLADAWLGFYVALTKSNHASGSAANTDAATTEIATEASLSEVASSHGGLSPRRVAGGETEDASRREDDKSIAGSPLSDISDELAAEQSATRRSRRSRRRRRTRGRGKKNAARALDFAQDDIDEECSSPENDADDDGIEPAMPSLPSASSSSSVCARHVLGAIMSTSPTSSRSPADQEANLQWPFQGYQSKNHCPGAVLPVGAEGAIKPSPDAGQTPTHREASARTPPRMRMACCTSPVAQMMTGTPTAFGTPTGRPVYVGGHAAYQGSRMAASSVDQASLPFSPVAVSPCHGPVTSAPPNYPAAMSAPPSYPAAAVSAPPSYPAAAVSDPPSYPAAVVSQQHACFQNAATSCPQNPVARASVDELRLWLSGGLPSSGEALAKHLQAIAPEVYED